MNEMNLILLALALVITFTTLEIVIIIAIIVKTGPSTGEKPPVGSLPPNDWQQSYYPDIIPFGVLWNPMLQRPYSRFFQGSIWKKP